MLKEKYFLCVVVERTSAVVAPSAAAALVRERRAVAANYTQVLFTFTTAVLKELVRE